MNYELKFLPSAWKEWQKLGATVRGQFKRKLAERLANPEVAADRLHGYPDHYKIKLRSVGYWLVYEVEKQTVTVYVIAVGKRENNQIYRALRKRKR